MVKSPSSVKEITVTSEYSSDVSICVTSAFLLVTLVFSRRVAFHLLDFPLFATPLLYPLSLNISCP